MPPVDDRVLSSLRKGALEPCVLGLLAGGETYGSEIAARLSDAGLIGGEGTIYPLLARLRRNELIADRWEESTIGPPRRYYRLTDRGRQTLHAFATVWGPFRDAVDDFMEHR